MTDRTLCPSCNREFELPKRFMVKFEDYDYSPIPRLLSCLHTVCHSCLEDQRDRSPINQIICPICKADEIIKSVRHLPLDITSLKEVIRNRNDEIVASCSRCYDSTPSFSWCKSCSSALCEFHHQDHLLSAETSKHSIYTFKEIFHRNMPISYQLPPIACPETLLKDCSIFCHNCLHLISSQAMVENHKDHEVENYLDTIEPMETAVKEAVSLSKEKYNQLDVQINSLQECLAKLDDSEEQILSDIGRTFSILQKKLKERENALLEKVNQIIEGKKRKVMKDIRKLKEIQDDCENALEVGESLLEDSKGNSIDQMYLVNAASGVEYRADTIAESVDETMKTIKPVDPIVKIDFLRDEVQSIKSIVLSLGGLAYIDDYSVEKSSSLRTDISADPTAEADSKTEDESKNSLVDNSKQVEEKDKTLDQPKIYFCVHVQNMSSKSDGAHGKQKMGQHQSSHISSGENEIQQRIIIEARLFKEDNPQDNKTKAIAISANQVKQRKLAKNRSKSNDNLSHDSDGGNSVESIQFKQDDRQPKAKHVVNSEESCNYHGSLLGRVILFTSVDKDVVRHHHFSSFFESIKEGPLPLLRISKELTPDSVD